MSNSKYPDKAWDVIMGMIDNTACEIMTKGGVFGWPINKKWVESRSDSLFTPPIAAEQAETLMGLKWTHPWGFLKDETYQACSKYFQLMCLGEMSVNDACEALQRETLQVGFNQIK